MISSLSIKPILTFNTSKGSQYWLDDKGRSQRFKSYHPEHGVKSQGLQSPFDHVIFVENSDADFIDIATTKHKKWSMIIRKGKVLIGSLEEDNKLRILSGPFDFSYEPRLGLAPIEIKKLEYKETIEGYIVKGSFHIGNKIVDLKYLNS